MKFKFLENIATADAAFLAYGKTPEEVFENAALALFETMVKTKEVAWVTSYKLQVTSFNLEDLLFDFLSELVFLKDEKGMVFSKFKVKINKLHATSYPGNAEDLRRSLDTLDSSRVIGPRSKHRDKLQASIWGEKIDPGRHNLKVDVKAVTRHLFGIKKEKNKFVARVVLDI